MHNGRLDLTVVRAHLREEAQVKHPTSIKDQPQVVLNAFDHTKDADFGLGRKADFYASFERGAIPDELATFIELEPSDYLKVEMRKAVINVISETLLDAEFTAKTLRQLQVPPELAILRTEGVPFIHSGRPQPDEQRETFCQLLQQITFDSRTVSKVSFDVPSTISYELPTEAGNPEEFRHKFRVYSPKWSSSIDSSALRPELVPIVVVKVYKLSESGGDRLLGSCLVQTSDHFDHENPLHDFWHTISPPLIYKLTSSKVFQRDEFSSPVKSVSSNSIINLITRQASLPIPKPKVQSFTSLWRLAMVLRDSTTASGVAMTALESLRNGGDIQVLPSGDTISVSHNKPFFGEVQFRSFFVPCEASSELMLMPELKTMKQFKEYEHESIRVPFDMAGGRLLPSMFNPAIIPEHRKGEELLGRIDFEVNDIEDLRSQEAYTQMLEKESLMKWRELLIRKKLTQGPEQWLAIEAVYETMPASNLGTNWIHSVTYHFGPTHPRFLLEIWIGNEFCGELLLPELSEMNKTKNLFPLVGDAALEGGLTRPDFRKRTAPREVKGWVWASMRWKWVNPKLGHVSLKVREVRNISTRSIRENDVMPGTPCLSLWKFEPTQNEWSELLTFPKFQHALYFLSSKDAIAMMKDVWKWDRSLLGPEPKWFNYFSWDTPGSLACVTKKIPVTVQGNVEMKMPMSIYDLKEADPLVVWRLLKNGVPSGMRTWLWMQLSGASVLRSQLNEYVQDKYRSELPAYEYVAENVCDCSDPVFNLIDADLDLIAAAYGLGAGHRHTLASILKCVAYVVAPINSMEKREEIMVRVSIENANLGDPIVYSSRIAILAYYLSLSFGPCRFTEEDIFYLILSLVSARFHHENADHSAPFQGYFAVDPESILPIQIPGAFNDATLLKLAIKCLHPEIFSIFENAGVTIDALFAPVFNTLCAGILPSQSLYRLWDMLTNNLMRPESLVEIDVSVDELETLVHNRSRSVSKSSRMCSGAREIAQVETYKKHVRAHSILFDNSVGRRCLFAFCYSLCLSVVKSLPAKPTALEIRQALQICGAELRDPSDVTRYVDRGDFVLFTSSSRTAQLARIIQTENKERMRQLERYQTQSKLIADVVWPGPFRFTGVSTNYVLESDLNPHVSRAQKITGVACRDPGLSTKDLRNLIYPNLKYHTLYCDPNVRSLAPDTLGRVAIKIDSLKFTKLEGQFNLSMSFDRVWNKSKAAVEQGRAVLAKSVFVYNITRPPPYLVRLAIQDLDGNTIIKMQKAIPISKLTTQGLTCTIIPSSFFSPPDIEIYISWSIYVASSQMFMPELGQLESLQPGKGYWGDLGVFAPLFVDSYPPSETEIPQPIKLVEFQPLDRPRCFNGLTKSALEDLLHFAFPTLLRVADCLIDAFGNVRDRTNFQQVLNTPVSPRELVTTLILISYGDLIEKVVLLFDLYGQHEPEKLTIQEETGESAFLGSNMLYYHPLATAEVACPNAMKQAAMLQKIEKAACEVDPMLPSKSQAEILMDPRTRINSISLVACAALLSQILPRAGVHMNLMDIFQLACQIFDPYSRIPRVLMAVLTCQRISSPPVNPTRGGSVVEPTPTCFNIWPEKGYPEEFQNLMDTSDAIDVTSALIRHVARSTAETGFYGLNFFTAFSLEALRIKDPFPGIAKALTILVTPTGDTADVEAVHVEVDESGYFTSGYGGNYLDIYAKSPEKVGSFSMRRDDLFFVEGSKALQAASYAFDLHRMVIDKFQFIISFLSNPLLSEILRRPSVLSRQFVKQPSLKVRASIYCKFSEKFHDTKVPLRFINEQPSKRKNRRSVREDDDISLDEGDDEITLIDSSSIVASSRQADSRRFEEVAVHGASLGSWNGPTAFVVTIRSLENFVASMASGDVFVVIEYGDQVSESRKFTPAANIEMDETFTFEADAEMGSIRLLLCDSAKDSDQDIIGECIYDYTATVRHRALNGDLNLPFTYGDEHVAILVCEVDLTALSSPAMSPKSMPPTVRRPSSGNSQHRPGSPTHSSKSVALVINPDNPPTSPANGQRSPITYEVRSVSPNFELIDRKSKQVKVTLVSADLNLGSLVPQDAKLNLSVKLACGSQIAKSKSVQCTNSPVWNEDLSFICGYLPRYLKFSILDDSLFQNDVLGETTFDLDELSGKGLHPLRLRIERQKQLVGFLDIQVKVSKLKQQQEMDLDWRNVKITIEGADHLPTALTSSKLQTYCRVDFEDEEGRTDIATADSHGQVVWSNSLVRYLDRPLKKPIKFEVFAVNGKTGDISLGAASMDIEEAKTKWRLAEGEAFMTTLKLDGYSAATGGCIVVVMNFGAPPKNIDHLKWLRVDLDEIVGLENLNGVTVSVEVGANRQQSELCYQTDPTVIPLHQSFDIPYDKDQIISFYVNEGRRVLGTCAYDLWALLRQGRAEDEGLLPLHDSDGFVIGNLQCGLLFVEAAPQPWPDVVLVDITDLQFDTYRPTPQSIKVRGADQFGEISHIHEVSSSHYYIGRTVSVPYRGQPSVWMDIRLNSRELSQAELPLPRSGLQSHHPIKTDLFADGSKIGTIECTLRFCHRPDAIDVCKYVRLSMVALNKCRKHHTDSELRHVCVSVDPGELLSPDDDPTKSFHTDYDQSHSIYRTTTRLLSDHVVLDDMWILPYQGQTFFRFQLHDADSGNNIVASADANVWELMNGRSEIVIQLHQPNARRSGNLYARIEFICPPRFTPKPKVVRIGFRSAENLGGRLRQEWPDMDLDVRVRSGRFMINPPVSNKKNKLSPSWGDWVGRLEIDPNESEELAVELYDKNRNEVIGCGSIHIWNTFRDPWAEWAGRVTLKRESMIVGRVTLAMRLQIPQRITVNFSQNTLLHQPLRRIKIHPTDTPRDFKTKFIAACREIAASTECRKLKHFYQMAEVVNTQKVFLVRQNPIYLSDKVRFIDCPHLFPNLIPDLNEEIELAILHVNNSKSQSVPQIHRQEAATSPIRDGEHIQVTEEFVEEEDSGFTFFPLGESTMPPSLTVSRKQNIIQSLKVVNFIDPNNRNLIKELSKRTFEFHPKSLAHLGALGHANIPLAEIQRFINQYNIRYSYGRSHQWCPVVIHTLTKDDCVVSRLSPVESVVGHDWPAYSRTIVLPRKSILTAFWHDESLQPTLYLDVGVTRATNFTSLGAAPWHPIPLARTASQMEEVQKAVKQRRRESNLTIPIITNRSPSATSSFQRINRLVSDQRMTSHQRLRV